MDQPQPPSDQSDAASELTESVAARSAGIAREYADVWRTQYRTWYDRSKAQSTWSAEDVVGDHTDLFEHLTPIVERSIDLTIELLRPWAKSFEARTR